MARCEKRVALWESVGYRGGTQSLRNPGGRAPPTQPPGFGFRSITCEPLAFRGTFPHALDAKNRLTVPAKFRSSLAAGVVLAGSPEVTPGEPRSLSIWTPDDYDAFTTSTLNGLNPLSPTARELKRFFFNHSHDTELDAAGRVMIPPFLMSYASLSKDVVVTGSGESLEVWDRTTFARYQEDVLARIPDIAASLGNTT